MGKEQQNQTRACPGCAELRAELTTLQAKVEALMVLTGVKPAARPFIRCACGAAATHEVTFVHRSGNVDTRCICDGCQPRNIFADAGGSTEQKTSDLPGAETARKINAALAA